MNIFDIINDVEVIKEDPIKNDEYVNMSVEGFMDIVNHKKKIMNLVYKINKLMRGKFKINIKDIWKWMKNKKTNTSNESIASSISIVAGVIIVIGFLLWIYKKGKKWTDDVIEKDKKIKEEERRRNSDNWVFDPNVKRKIFNNDEMKKKLKLCEECGKYTAKLIEGFGNKKIKESPKEYVEKRYKKYIDEFELIIRELNKGEISMFRDYGIIDYSDDVDESKFKYGVFHDDKKYLRRRKEKTLKEHGYTEDDAENIYHKNFDYGTEDWVPLDVLEKHIEKCLYNPEHVQLMIDICETITRRILYGDMWDVVLNLWTHVDDREEE